VGEGVNKGVCFDLPIGNYNWEGKKGKMAGEGAKKKSQSKKKKTP